MKFWKWVVVVGCLFQTSTLFAQNNGGGGSSFGDFRIGPVLTLGLPHPWNLSVETRIGDMISLGVGGGAFTYGLTIEDTDIDLSLTNFDVRVGFHPMAGSLLIGMKLGQQQLVATANKDLGSLTVGSQVFNVDVEGEATVTTMYLTPFAGWAWLWDIGFFLGVEVGYQLALSSDSDLELETDPAEAKVIAEQTDEYKQIEEDIKTAQEDFGEAHLPYVALLRIGWLF